MGRKKKDDKKAKPVFDLEDEYFVPKASVPSEVKPKEKEKDKIFGNDFNMGNLAFNDFPVIKVDGEYANSHLDDVYDSEDYHIRKELTEKCYEIFKKSQWADLPLNKRFSKELMPFIFNDLFKELDVDNNSAVDIFITIAEFMDVPYEKVVECAGIKIKERITFELDQKYKILKSKSIKRLF